MGDKSAAPPQKRPLLEISDSEEFNQLNDSLIQMVTSLENKPKKSIEDVFNLLSIYIKRDMAKEERQKEITHKLIELEEKTIEHDVIIETVQSEITSIKTLTAKLETATNRNEQKKVDNDVFVSFFPKKPDAESTAKNLLSLMQIPTNTLLNAYSFQLRNTPNANSTPQSSQQSSSKFALVLSFTDYNHKVKFLQNRKNLGPIKMSQLINSTQSANITIRATNRLSTFNLRAVKVLTQAKNDKIVADFKMANGLFKYQRKADERWWLLSCEDQIQALAKSNYGLNG